MKKKDLNQLLKQHTAATYEEQYRLITGLVQDGMIKPVKASGLNGKKPALYREYWILEPKKDYQDLIEELKFRLVPAIHVDYYLAHPDIYAEDRQWVLLMDEYLRTQRNRLETMESMNERSFEIWGREKFLKQEKGRKLLKRMGITLEFLNLYETTEPLSYYSHSRQVPQNLLIIENKDTFYTMRRYLLNGGWRILNMEIGTLIYGAGKGILRSFRDFSLCVEPYMNDSRNTIYYFGDLDYEGIGIYENLYSLFDGYCQIKPFTAAYTAMLKKAGRTEDLPETKEKQNRNIGSVFFDCFEEDYKRKIMDILAKERYIPQEILTIRDL